MKKSIVLLALALPFSNVQAGDPRLDTERYDANRVYNVYTKIGKVTLIQFEDDETITSTPSSLLGMGDTAAWTLGVRGNNITFKPAKRLPDTNMVVVTNKRTYSFEIKNLKAGDATYILRFDYPDTDAAKLAAEVRRQQITAAARAEKVGINTEYYWRGDNVLLKPTAAYDDGRFTHLVYDHAGVVPNFYKVMPDVSEALLNTHIDTVDKNTVVLQDVVKTVRARLGKEVIEIINHHYQVPKFNQFGTSEAGAVRVEKGAK